MLDEVISRNPVTLIRATDLEECELRVLPPVVSPLPAVVSETATVVEHHAVADGYRRLVLRAPLIASDSRPGQFVMVTVGSRPSAAASLPRPMAIYGRWETEGLVEIQYKVVGMGTRTLSGAIAAEPLLLVGPLGRPFDVADDSRGVLLIGRGIGTCSLTTVAQDNRTANIRTIAVASGRTRTSIVGHDQYRDCERTYLVTDEDGSSDPDMLYRRLIEDLDSDPPDTVLTCGSERLLRLSRVLAGRWDASVQVSVEAHMACGIGFCHGCAAPGRSATGEGPLICKDGPVFAVDPACRSAVVR